jgi:hypothetical protein
MKNTIDVDINLDVKYYREYNPDLQHFDEDQLRSHYLKHGQKEGRPNSMVREHLLKNLKNDVNALEIGPFTNPTLRGDNVKYFDIMPYADLVNRALSIGYTIKEPIEIHYTSPSGDLGEIPDKFDAVISSHCIEHQIDLIGHLNSVSDLLEDGGRYYLIIPDKRYCFDHFINESTIADVIGANFIKRETHHPKSVVEHFALTTHNDCVRHWSGDHLDDDFRCSRNSKLMTALKKLRDTAGYIDVHAWQFTPNSFNEIIKTLNEISLTNL